MNNTTFSKALSERISYQFYLLSFFAFAIGILVLGLVGGFLLASKTNNSSDWKIYKNSERHFSIHYPTGLTPQMFGNIKNGVTFAGKDDNDGFAFIVENGTITNNNSNNGTITRLAATLFSGNPGKIIQENPIRSDFSNETVTKIKDLTINGYQAVQFTDDFAAEGQSPSNYSDDYIIKVNNSYFLIRNGYVNTRTKLIKNEVLFDQIVKTFSYL